VRHRGGNDKIESIFTEKTDILAVRFIPANPKKKTGNMFFGITLAIIDFINKS